MAAATLAGAGVGSKLARKIKEVREDNKFKKK